MSTPSALAVQNDSIYQQQTVSEPMLCCKRLKNSLRQDKVDKGLGSFDNDLRDVFGGCWVLLGCLVVEFAPGGA